MGSVGSQIRAVSSSKMKFLAVAVALVAGVSAEADADAFYSPYALPYAYGAYTFGGKSAPCVNAANIQFHVPVPPWPIMVTHMLITERETLSLPLMLRPTQPSSTELTDTHTVLDTDTLMADMVSPLLLMEVLLPPTQPLVTPLPTPLLE